MTLNSGHTGPPLRMFWWIASSDLGRFSMWPPQGTPPLFLGYITMLTTAGHLRVPCNCEGPLILHLTRANGLNSLYAYHHFLFYIYREGIRIRVTHTCT